MTPKTIAEALAGNTYPGRGIAVGLTPDGSALVLTYFIMGRSVNSRNRVLVEDGGAVYTRSVDDSLVSDPSLIIYPALRVVGGVTVLTNGDQTDTIAYALADGGTFHDALQTRSYEPDAPNYTPRISAIADASRVGYQISLLRAFHGTTMRAFWEYTAVPGQGHLIHTYSGDGDPLPSFTGEPVTIATADDLIVWADACWDALDAGNRISLMARFLPVDGGTATTRIINRFGKGPA